MFKTKTIIVSLVLIAFGISEAVGAENPGDHYLFYKYDIGVEFDKIEIALADQFSPEGKAFYFHVIQPIEVGNPANVNDNGILDPETHLVACRIFPKYVKNVLQGLPVYRKLPKLLVTNQFGAMTVKLLDLPHRLLVPSAKSLNGPVEPPENPPIDHFQCYGIKKAKGFVPQQVSVVNQFEDPKDIFLLLPTSLCNPTDKNGEGIQHPEQHLVCYIVLGGNSNGGREVWTNNQFGPLAGLAQKETELCVSSSKAILDRAALEATGRPGRIIADRPQRLKRAFPEGRAGLYSLRGDFAFPRVFYLKETGSVLELTQKMGRVIFAGTNSDKKIAK